MNTRHGNKQEEATRPGCGARTQHRSPETEGDVFCHQGETGQVWGWGRPQGLYKGVGVTLSNARIGVFSCDTVTSQHE